MASRGPLIFFQLENAHRIERILYGTKPPAHYRRQDRFDRELSMAMAMGAMPGGTSPPLSLLSGYWEIDWYLRKEIHSNLTNNQQELHENR
jgi:hypothetical protein